MARQLLGLSGDEAIRWVRQYIPGAVETELQEELVNEYIPGGANGNKNLKPET
jgi:hypothetical protein